MIKSEGPHDHQNFFWTVNPKPGYPYVRKEVDPTEKVITEKNNWALPDQCMMALIRVDLEVIPPCIHVLPTK